MTSSSKGGFWCDPSATCDPGADVGRGTKIWGHAHVMAGASVGSNCVIGQGCSVAAGARLGRGVRLQNGVFVCGGVQLGAGVFCGPGVVFTNVKRPRAFIDQRLAYCETVVDEGATLGANATVLPGIRVGAFALVGAGSVVTRDVPAFSEVAGNPARHRGWITRAGSPLVFDASGRARCATTGDEYELTGRSVALVQAGSWGQLPQFRPGLIDAD